MLATAQAASSANGIYVSATGAWTRATDMADGSTFMPATLVAVSTATNPGANNDTIWQLTTTASGTVGTNAQNWAKVLQGGLPKTYTQGNGIVINQTTGVVEAKAGSGIIVDTGGIRLDEAAVVRKRNGFVPAGSLTATITHDLNTTAIECIIRDAATGNKVAVCDTVVNSTTITVEFATAPTASQYTYTLFG